VTNDFHSFISRILHAYGLIDRDEFALRLANSLSKIERWDKQRIIGAARELSTSLHKLNRERTKDEVLELIASRIMKRWPDDPRPPVKKVKEVVNILFVGGDRGGTRRNQVQLPLEFHAIDDAIRGSEYSKRFHVGKPMLMTTHERLVTAYRSRPSIIHFGGHGNDRSLSIMLDQGLLVSEAPLRAEQLAAILNSFPERLRLCVLNTCDSAAIAEKLVDSDSVDFAIGWPQTLDDSVAIAFSRALYGSLGDGLNLSKAVVLAEHSCGAAEGPVLYSVAGIDPTGFSFVERGAE
jgi:hypothetical protein